MPLKKLDNEALKETLNKPLKKTPKQLGNSQ
jgi:hypothetical protein